MKAFDVVKYICFGDTQRPVSSMVDTFPFEHSEESLTVSNSTTYITDKKDMGENDTRYLAATPP